MRPILLLALTLALTPLSTGDAARPLLPPPPAHVGAVDLGGGAYLVTWAQPSDATRVLFGAGLRLEERAGAPVHQVLLGPGAGWRPGEPVTIIEDWPGDTASWGEIYVFLPRPQTLYLPALVE
jgi:hypothetical protein